MKPTIKIGNEITLEFTVTDGMKPTFHNKVIHPVCSTWDLAHQFEIAARLTLEPHLEMNEQGIGTHLSINHLKPLQVGRTVLVKATIVDLDTSTVVCELVALIDGEICAEGKQIQRVLPANKIKQIIQLGSED